GRALRDLVEVDARRELDPACVDPQDRLAARTVRSVDHDLAVEPARAEERRVQDLRTVRRGHDDDDAVRIEPVHLDQELVQRLLAFVVRRDAAVAAALAGRVQLVDEDDARRLRLRALEELPDPGRADADEDLDELRAADREERDARLARDRTGEERLARARRADQEHALRDPRTELCEPGRILQELDDLDQLFLRLV